MMDALFLLLVALLGGLSLGLIGVCGALVGEKKWSTRLRLRSRRCCWYIWPFHCSIRSGS